MRLALTLALSATTATAQAPACAPRAAVLEKLAETYGETRRGIGLAGNNTVIEVFASDAGSWSIINTNTAGITCLIASGQAYEDLAEALPPQL